MKHRILVTGGAGFIGSNLCRRLLREGNEVVCADDLSTGRMENIAELLADRSFSFDAHDVTQPMDYDVDRIFHLACPASPPHYQSDPVKTLKTSFLGSLHALELATRTGARILFTSTSEVYGEPLVHPQPEVYRGNVNPIGLRACYDEGKRAAEALFFDYHRQYGADIRVVRIFNTYGPYMDPADGRVVSNCIMQALRGEDITVYGDGTQTRCFCYVTDTVEGLLRMMDCEGFTGPVNIGNPKEVTVMELAERIIAMTGTDSSIVTRPLPSDDPTRRRPDITLAQRDLGWRPVVSLEEGLQKTIAYFRGRD